MLLQANVSNRNLLDPATTSFAPTSITSRQCDASRSSTAAAVATTTSLNIRSGVKQSVSDLCHVAVSRHHFVLLSETNIVMSLYRSPVYRIYSFRCFILGRFLCDDDDDDEVLCCEDA